MKVADYFYLRVTNLHNKYDGVMNGRDDEKIRLYEDMKTQSVKSVAYGQSNTDLHLVVWLDFGDSSGAVIEQYRYGFNIKTGPAVKLKHVARRLADKHGLAKAGRQWSFGVRDDG